MLGLYYKYFGKYYSFLCMQLPGWNQRASPFYGMEQNGSGILFYGTEFSLRVRMRMRSMSLDCESVS